MQAVQVRPVPKYPALQAQTETSEVEPARHVADRYPLAEHVLQAVQVRPVPKYPALHWHAETSEVEFGGHTADR